VDSFGDDPTIRILPQGDQEVRQGRNIVLTCRAQVRSRELVRDLRWYDPRGLPVQQDDRVYSEEQPGDAATALFIKNVQNRDAGQYTCRATYASNQKLEASVKIQIFVGITWEDAPKNQYARLGSNYKIRCQVRAQPPANIDWLKESFFISTGDQYVIESDGLVIQGITKENAGTYTCRARVPVTGELEERDIQLDVQEPPSWVQKPFDVKGVELKKVEMLCGALGSPPPKYTWVDWDGIEATERKGWKLDEITGTLTGYQVRRQDEGRYTCIAENNAGREEASAFLDVIIRPKVQQLYNKTFEVGKVGAELTCKGSGDPLPRLIWRKWSSNEPFVVGGQPNDARIIVSEGPIPAPEYTEGEKNWIQSVLRIDGIQRPDDGLYECLAENEGGKFFKSGHITVHFAPSFEDQIVNKEWSWDQRPVNLTCIARSIPNATISWWYNEVEIGRDDLDPRFEIRGHGPRSDLVITPTESTYYRTYKCKAENPFGVKYHEIVLEEAQEPSMLQQAILDKNTATSFQFRFIPPTHDGGVKIENYAVEYKVANTYASDGVREDWTKARRRVWPVDEDGFGYVLEGLYPKTAYDMRFGTRNRVGFSQWSPKVQYVTSDIGAPLPPILRIQTGSRHMLRESEDDVITLPASKEYEVSWTIPEDNGIKIDYFLLSYYPVAYRNSSRSFAQIGDIQVTEIPHRGNVRWGLQLDYQDTFYKVGLKAHNDMGFSKESALYVKTPREPSSTQITPPNATPADGGSACVVLPAFLFIKLAYDLILGN